MENLYFAFLNRMCADACHVIQIGLCDIEEGSLFKVIVSQSRQ